MEKNLKFDNNTKTNLGNAAVQLLIQKNMINDNDLKSLKLEYGYIFLKDNGEIEALFRVVLAEREYYFALQKGSLMLVNLSNNQYLQTIEGMENYHPCLMDESLNETVEEKNNRILVEKGITVSEKLLCYFNEFNSVKMKSLESICKRAIASLLIVQIVSDINNGDDVSKSLEFFGPMLKKFNVLENLNSKEQRIINKSYTKQDLIDLDWEYETYWALCWALGLVDDISDASILCDCQKAVDFVSTCNSLEDFQNRCKLRTVQEILDMHDLYYRYNWAINSSKVNSGVSLGNINASNVIERRRGLEWILSSEEDWYNMSLNT